MPGIAGILGFHGAEQFKQPRSTGAEAFVTSRFLRRCKGYFRIGLQFADTVVIVASGVVSSYIRTGHFQLDQHHVFALLFTALIAVIVFPALDIYRPWRSRHVFTEIRKVVLAWACVIILGMVVAYLTKTGAEFSRIWVSLWVVTGMAGLIGSRLAVHALISYARKSGYNRKNAIVIGSGTVARTIAARLKDAQWTGIDVVALFGDEPYGNAEAGAGLRMYGTLEQSLTLIRTGSPEQAGLQVDTAAAAKLRRIDDVWVSLPLDQEWRIREVVEALDQCTTTVHFLPNIFESQSLNHSVDEFAGLPVITINQDPIVGSRMVVKTVFDWLAASACLVVASPVMLITALLIKLESPGPVLFRQRRYGFDGREIVIWKFRSMTVCEDATDHIVQAGRHDTRVTRIGAFLRRSSLDELPQLFNVLQGRMSLIGPRPHAVAHNEEYKRMIRGYMWRHKVKPGLTGWAQINGWRGETDTVDKMKMRVHFDIEYIHNWSLWFDIKILLLTVVRGFFNKNAY